MELQTRFSFVTPISAMTQSCPNCLSSFTCQVATTCWCARFPPLLELKDSKSCLCPTCLKNQLQTATEQYAAEVIAGERPNEAPLYQNSSQGLQEDIDYYLENNLYVFKAWYHLKRGTCCGSGCRHCPYKKINRNH